MSILIRAGLSAGAILAYSWTQALKGFFRAITQAPVVPPSPANH